MNTPDNLEASARRQSDQELAEIQERLEKELDVAEAGKLPQAIVKVEDYSNLTRERLPELVEKCRAHGWNAQYKAGGHFIIYLKPHPDAPEPPPRYVPGAPRGMLYRTRGLRRQ